MYRGWYAWYVGEVRGFGRLALSTQQIISIAASADDAQVSKASAAYQPVATATYASTGTTINTIREFSTPNYRIFNILLRFDSSALPDAAVPISALLRVVMVDKQFGDALSITGEYFTWTGTAADYSPTPSSTAFSPVLISSLPAANVTKDFTLLNPRTSISVTGETAIRLHITQLSGDAAPTGRNYVTIAAQDHLTLNEPQLVVNYELSTRMAPDAILSTNLAGSVSAIQDDARSPDASWLTI